MKLFKEILELGDISISKIEDYRIKQLEKLKKRTVNGIIVGAFVIAASFYIAQDMHEIWVLGVGVVLGVVLFFIFRGNIRTQIKNAIKEQIVKKLIEGINPGFKYYPKQHITEETFDDSKLIGNYTYLEGEDLFKGIYNNIPVEFSEIEVTKKASKSTKTLFEGPFYSLKVNKPFKGRTSVVPDFSEKNFGKIGRVFQSLNLYKDTLITIDNENFEKQFAIYTTNEDEAKEILTQKLMNFLLEEKKSTNGVFFGFSMNNIYFGKYNSKDLYRVNIEAKITEKIIKRFYNEILQHLQVVEKLYKLVLSQE